METRQMTPFFPTTFPALFLTLISEFENSSIVKKHKITNSPPPLIRTCAKKVVAFVV